LQDSGVFVNVTYRALLPTQKYFFAFCRLEMISFTVTRLMNTSGFKGAILYASKKHCSAFQIPKHHTFKTPTKKGLISQAPPFKI
jgi:hypothetical protein